MSEDLYKRGNILITRFHGGRERGTCLQLNVGREYERLTVEEWRELVAAVDAGLLPRRPAPDASASCVVD